MSASWRWLRTRASSPERAAPWTKEMKRQRLVLQGMRLCQLGEERVHDVANYIKKGKLWQAFDADSRVVLLIDEVDKADIEFPNDLLQELDHRVCVAPPRLLPRQLDVRTKLSFDFIPGFQMSIIDYGFCS